MSAFEGGSPLETRRRSYAPSAPRQGVVEQLAAPGLAIPSPNAARSDAGNRLMAALGMTAQLVGQIGRMVEVRSQTEERLQKELAYKHAATRQVELLDQIEQRKITLPEGVQAVDFVDDLLSQEVEGFSQSYASAYHAALRPRLVDGLIGEQRKMQSEALDENLRLAGDGAAARPMTEIDESFTVMRELKPAITAAEIAKYSASAAESAARLGQADRLEAILKHWEGHDPNAQTQLREIAKQTVFEQYRQNINSRELAGADPLTLIEEVRKQGLAGKINPDDAISLIQSVNSRVEYRKQQSESMAQVLSNYRGDHVALGAAHDTAHMEVLGKLGLWDTQKRQPTDPIRLAANLRERDHVPGPVIDWIRDAATAEDPGLNAQAAHAYWLLQAIPTSAMQKAADGLPDHVKAKLDMIAADLNLNSPQDVNQDGTPNPKFQQRLKEAVARYSGWTKQLYENARETAGQLVTERQGVADQIGTEGVLRTGIEAWQREDVWWGPIPNRDVHIDPQRFPPGFSRDLAQRFEHQYTMLKDLGVGGPEQWKTQAAKAAIDQLRADYLYATIQNQLFVLRRRETPKDVHWKPETEKSLREFMQTLVDDGRIDHGWWAGVKRTAAEDNGFSQVFTVPWAATTGAAVSRLENLIRREPMALHFMDDLEPFTVPGESGIRFAIDGEVLVDQKSGAPIVFNPAIGPTPPTQDPRQAPKLLAQKAEMEQLGQQDKIMRRIDAAARNRAAGKPYDLIIDFVEANPDYALTEANWRWFKTREQPMRVGMSSFPNPFIKGVKEPPPFDGVPSEDEMAQYLGLDPRKRENEKISRLLGASTGP